MLVYPGSGLSPEEYRFQSQPFLDQLKGWVSNPVILKLQGASQLFAGDKVLSKQDVLAQGLNIVFDEKKLELYVNIPPNLRKTNIVYLSDRGVLPNSENALSPSALSSFVNLRLGQDFNFNQSTESLNGRQRLRGDVDGALNYKSWVLEALGSYSENSASTRNQVVGVTTGSVVPSSSTATSTRQFTRGDIRVVHDDPKGMVRYAAGDLSYPITSYQRFRPLAGFTVARNFSLQPYRVTIPVSNTELYLKSPSRVVVWVNGYRVQTLQLPAGRHDLRNLVLGNGINDVRLEITDDVGRTEVQTFSMVPDADLLEPGLHQFAYSAGFPSTDSSGFRQYNSKLFTASAFHRLGLTENWTSGLNFQADHLQSLAGAEFLYTTAFGTLGLEPALSHLNQSYTSYSIKVRDLFTDYRGPAHTQRNFGVSIENRGTHFAQFDELAPNVSEAYDFGLTYGQSVFWGISARVAGDYQINRRNNPNIVNAYGASLNFVKGWDNGLQLSLTLSDRRSQSDLTDRGAFLLASWQIPQSNHFLSTSVDTARQAERLDWRYNTPQVVGGFNSAVGLENAKESKRVNASADYTANRGTIGVSHDLLKPTGATQAMQTTSLRAGTAVVFAGGQFGVSRPVLDSFAIIAPISRLKNQTIDVNPNGNEFYEARTDWLGPAVVPTMRSYQYFRLYFDPSRLDPGYELGQENYNLIPSYKSGFLIPVGIDATVLLSGILVDPTGRPIELEAGTARFVGDNTLPLITLFTNRKGKFQMEGFKPGEYELTLFNEKRASVRIKIPEKTSGMYNIGEISVGAVK